MKARERRDHLVRRVPLLERLFVAALVLVAGSYWSVQLVQGSLYRELAENNRFRRLPVRAPRGLVYDRHGQLLVENVPSYDLLLDRDRTDDPDASMTHAGILLETPAAALERVVEERGGRDPYRPVLVAEGLTLSEVARFGATALEHPEFEVDVGQVRLYRYGSHAAHVLGHLGEASPEELAAGDGAVAPGDLVGRRGVERTYEPLLRGQDGERVVVVDSRGRVAQEYAQIPGKPGRNLRLTLDLEMQQRAARFFEGKAGAAVVLDADSGEVLVLYSAPSYDPNLFSHRLDRAEWQAVLAAPGDPLQNRAIQNTYSPGSVFKVVMAVAGLAEGVVDADDTVRCAGATRIYGRRFRCWKRAGHGRVDLHEAIRSSCDVYFYRLGERLGIEKIAAWARRFDLGRPTGIDLRGEKAGLVPDPGWSLEVRDAPWYPGETISVAIGQGPLLVTPLQVASMMALVANGGWRVSPHLLLTGERRAPVEVEIDPALLAPVREALAAVVATGGTGQAAQVPGVDVGGKTGTVQVVRQETWIDAADLPYEHRDHAWFAAFASAGGQRLALAIFVEHGGRGSRAAAPLARELIAEHFDAEVDDDRSL